MGPPECSMQDLMAELRKINTYMSQGEEKYNALKTELLKDSKEVKTKMDQILKKVEDAHENVHKNTNRTDKIEAEKRKRNIIIFGLPETQQERRTDLEGKIMDVLRNKLKSNIKVEEIDFIMRMGKQRSEKTRGVLVRLTTLRRKFDLLGLKGNLKGSKLYSTEHYSRDVNEKRKPLLEEAKRLRSEGKYAQVRYDKLHVIDRRAGTSSSGQNQAEANPDSSSGFRTKRKPSESPSTGDIKARTLKKKHNKNEENKLYDIDSDKFNNMVGVTPTRPTVEKRKKNKEEGSLNKVDNR